MRHAVVAAMRAAGPTEVPFLQSSHEVRRLEHSQS
jgi:hypothetical protein